LKLHYHSFVGCFNCLKQAYCNVFEVPIYKNEIANKLNLSSWVVIDIQKLKIVVNKHFDKVGNEYRLFWSSPPN
jgi:hypothetical protein